MKSIEEAAKEYAKLEYEDLYDEDSLDVDITIKDFTKGVEFSQRWIQVEEELPDNFTSVLVRDNECSPIRSTAIYLDGVFHPDFVLTHNQVTHWRPIEYK